MVTSKCFMDFLPTSADRLCEHSLLLKEVDILLSYLADIGFLFFFLILPLGFSLMAFTPLVVEASFYWPFSMGASSSLLANVPPVS